jgi:triosephosphate isomerase
MKKRKIVIGNWKMNPETFKNAKILHDNIKKRLIKVKRTIPVVCPPSLYVSALRGKTTSRKMAYGVQDVSSEKSGAHTGELSVSMLKSVGVSYCIVGHSERRAKGETDELVSKKAALLIEGGIIPVVCIGELSVDARGDYLIYIKNQLIKSLAGISSAHISKVIIAYEPVFAVGASEPVTSHTVHQRNIFIRKVLADLYGKNKAFEVSILYGGSVTSVNASELVKGGDVDGLLVGRSSLMSDDFVGILQALDTL